MTFKELQNLSEKKLGIIRLADIARELGVTPQVVSNWKARDQVPYKYFKKFKKKINKIDKEKARDGINKIVSDKKTINVLYPSLDSNEDDNVNHFYDQVIATLTKLFKNFYIISISGLLTGLIGFLYLSFFVSPLYVSKTTILPYGSNAQSEVSGIASQFGFSVGANETDFSLRSCTQKY